MKKLIYRLFLLMLLSIPFSSVFAQDPPPPPNGGHGQSGNQQPGGSAPLNNGIFVLAALAAAYGAFKMYKVYQLKHQTAKDSL